MSRRDQEMMDGQQDLIRPGKTRSGERKLDVPSEESSRSRSGKQNVNEPPGESSKSRSGKQNVNEPSEESSNTRGQSNPGTPRQPTPKITQMFTNLFGKPAYDLNDEVEVSIFDLGTSIDSCTYEFTNLDSNEKEHRRGSEFVKAKFNGIDCMVLKDRIGSRTYWTRDVGIFNPETVYAPRSSTRRGFREEGQPHTPRRSEPNLPEKDTSTRRSVQWATPEQYISESEVESSSSSPTQSSGGALKRDKGKQRERDRSRDRQRQQGSSHRSSERQSQRGSSQQRGSSTERQSQRGSSRERGESTEGQSQHRPSRHREDSTERHGQQRSSRERGESTERQSQHKSSRPREDSTERHGQQRSSRERGESTERQSQHRSSRQREDSSDRHNQRSSRHREDSTERHGQSGPSERRDRSPPRDSSPDRRASYQKPKGVRPAAASLPPDWLLVKENGKDSKAIEMKILWWAKRGGGSVFFLEAPGLGNDPAIKRGLIRGTKTFGDDKLELFMESGGKKLEYASLKWLSGRGWSKKNILIYTVFDSKQGRPKMTIVQKDGKPKILNLRERESWTVVLLGDEKGPYGLFRRSDLVKRLGESETDTELDIYRGKSGQKMILHPKPRDEREKLMGLGAAVAESHSPINSDDEASSTSIHANPPSPRREATDEGYVSEGERPRSKGKTPGRGPSRPRGDERTDRGDRKDTRDGRDEGDRRDHRRDYDRDRTDRRDGRDTRDERNYERDRRDRRDTRDERNYDRDRRDGRDDKRDYDRRDKRDRRDDRRDYEDDRRDYEDDRRDYKDDKTDSRRQRGDGRKGEPETSRPGHCSICGDLTSEMGIELPCRHVYDPECLREWVGYSDSPNCVKCQKLIPREILDDIQGVTEDSEALTEDSEGYKVRR